jgi:hypothetical protein
MRQVRTRERARHLLVALTTGKDLTGEHAQSQVIHRMLLIVEWKKVRLFKAVFSNTWVISELSKAA